MRRIIDEVAQATLAVSSTLRLQIPTVHWLAAFELHVDATVSTTAGAVTIVNTTLGAIPLVTRVRLLLDGGTTVVDVSGTILDTWSKVDRPGSERLALSSTTSGDPWNTSIRWEAAQSEANPAGSIPLWLYGNCTVEVETGAISLIGSGTNISIAGDVRLVAEKYDQRSPFANPAAVGSSIHRLSTIEVDYSNDGSRRVELKSYTGELLERLLVVANNNAANTWDLFSRMSLMASQAEILQRFTNDQMRARQLRNYGGENMPIAGVWVFDLRRAGEGDVIQVGHPVTAPDLHVITEIASGTALTNARATFVAETLVPVRRAPSELAAAA
ncbi:MAG: hypothetical protein AMXMBFR23_03150 [Chloroflexota bacterium]